MRGGGELPHSQLAVQPFQVASVCSLYIVMLHDFNFHELP